MFLRFREAKFQLSEFFVLKIGPDWEIFSRANMRGKNSLRHELPHTRNPGLVRATVNSGGFVLARNKQATGGWGSPIFFGFFLQ